MSWEITELKSPIKIVSLHPGQTVFGIYTGLIASPKFPLTMLVTMERIEGEQFAFYPGLVLQQWLMASKVDLVGRVLSVTHRGKVDKCDAYKVGLWTGSLSELMQDRTYVELNMRLNSVLGS